MGGIRRSVRHTYANSNDLRIPPASCWGHRLLRLVRVPDAVQRAAPLGAERCTAEPGVRVITLGEQLKVSADGNLRRRQILGNDEIEGVILPLPLPGDERSLAHVLHRLPGPSH